MIEEDSIYNSVKKNYNQGAWEFSRSRTFFFRDLEFIKNYPKKEDKILDFGCGNGRLIDFLKTDPSNYWGVDVSVEMLWVARKINPNHRFFLIKKKLEETLSKNTEFDFIFSVGVFHHLPPGEKRKKIVQEIFSFLKPGGRLFVSVWDLGGERYAKFLEDKKEALIPFRSGSGNVIFERYCYSFSLKELIGILEEAGFVLVESGKTKRNGKPANIFCLVEKPMEKNGDKKETKELKE
jgi:SAM-dependent methyltransferase